MKRIVLMLVAALMMGGMAMAQDNRRGGDEKMNDPKVRAERMTERMAKEYNLNDTQKQQLLEANMALMEKKGDMPAPGRRGEMRRPPMKKENGCCCQDSCSKEGKKAGKKHDKKEGQRPQMTEEEREQMKAEMEKKRQEMKAAHAAYQEQLQKIMTKEQYEAYTKKMQDRKPREKK